MNTRVEIVNKLKNLVDQFSRQLEAYRSGKYNETTLRVQFVDPLFELLGWDVYNKEGLAESYKDVVHEDSIKVDGATKAPDYSFRIGGVRKFFLETKKPSVNIKDDISPAFQLRRYGYSAQLSLSILTDFEEFAIYDTTVAPHEKDSAARNDFDLLVALDSSSNCCIAFSGILAEMVDVCIESPVCCIYCIQNMFCKQKNRALVSSN